MLVPLSPSLLSYFNVHNIWSWPYDFALVHMFGRAIAGFWASWSHMGELFEYTHTIRNPKLDAYLLSKPNPPLAYTLLTRHCLSLWAWCMLSTQHYDPATPRHHFEFEWFYFAGFLELGHPWVRTHVATTDLSALTPPVPHWPTHFKNLIFRVPTFLVSGAHHYSLSHPLNFSEVVKPRSLKFRLRVLDPFFFEIRALFTSGWSPNFSEMTKVQTSNFRVWTSELRLYFHVNIPSSSKFPTSKPPKAFLEVTSSSSNASWLDFIICCVLH